MVTLVTLAGWIGLLASVGLSIYLKPKNRKATKKDMIIQIVVFLILGAFLVNTVIAIVSLNEIHQLRY